MRALLRRASITAPVAVPLPSVLTKGHITVDEERRRALKNGEEIELTVKEFDLILFLMKNPGRVYSRENLLDLVWGYDYQGDTRTVDVHIRRLREKLELDPANPAISSPNGAWGTTLPIKEPPCAALGYNSWRSQWCCCRYCCCC